MNGKEIICKTRSPIEQMLATEILSQVQNNHDSILRVETQTKLGRYRADIAIYEDDGLLLLVIECDGHEFHDRTKEQAARDRRRDRWVLETYDAPTVRFTGSEIYADAQGCAEYCVSLAYYLSYKFSLMRKADALIAQEAVA